MNATTTIAKMVAAMPKTSDREALIKAHDFAADFHNAMSDALTNERDLEDAEADLKQATTEAERENLRLYKAECEKLWADAMGRVASSVLKMPFKWAVILNERADAPAPVEVPHA